MTMEKKQNTNSPKRVCEKFFRAVTLNPAIYMIRRISRRPPNPSLPKHQDSFEKVQIHFDYSTPKNSQIKARPEYTEPRKSPVYVQGHNHNQIAKQKPLTEQGNPVTRPQTPASKTEPFPSFVAPSNHTNFTREKISSSGEAAKAHKDKKFEEGAKLGGMHIEDRFTNYINEAKRRIRGMSHDYSSETDSGNKDSSRDVFADYINSTKGKIRTTSSLGGGRNRTGLYT